MLHQVGSDEPARPQQQNLHAGSFAGRGRDDTASFQRNVELLMAYRFHSRRGSVASRNDHSRPLRCIQRGACRTRPE
ncbi:hypothetical protein D3C83_185790 [compost metagenome]